MKWEALPLADRAKLMAAAVRNGYTDIRSIKEAYTNYLNLKQSAGNRYAKGGDTDEPEVVNLLDKLPVWKALEKIDYTAIPDPEFTREKTGAGSIEYFSAEEPEGITYNNGYHRDHPMPGHDVILYDPNTNDEQDIRLDALHIMPKDPTYDALNSIYRNTSWEAKDDNYNNARSRYDNDKVLQSVKYIADKVTGKNVNKEDYKTDPFIQYFNNEADGLLRNMFIEGSEDYIWNKKYWPYKDDLREWNAHLMPYINRIEQYLRTGERPADILPELIVTDKKAYGGNLFQTGGNKKSKKKSLLLKLQERRDYYRQQLIIRGLRGAQLEAVLANMEVESGFNPDNVNPYSGAKGLMQWLGSRKPKSWSEKDQLDYIAATYNKFGGNEWLDKAAWKRFNETTDPAEAARLFRRYWERPEKSSWYATDALFKNSNSYLPKETNDLIKQVASLEYNGPKEPRRPVFTEADLRLLDSPILASHNVDYDNYESPDYQESPLMLSIKLNPAYDEPDNPLALYSMLASLQSESALNDPYNWMSTLMTVSPKTTPELKQTTNWLFAPRGNDYLYHGLNFAAYGGNLFSKGGERLTDEEMRNLGWHWGSIEEILPDDPLASSTKNRKDELFIFDEQGNLVSKNDVENYINSTRLPEVVVTADKRNFDLRNYLQNKLKDRIFESIFPDFVDVLNQPLESITNPLGYSDSQARKLLAGLQSAMINSTYDPNFAAYALTNPYVMKNSIFFNSTNPLVRRFDEGGNIEQELTIQRSEFDPLGLTDPMYEYDPKYYEDYGIGNHPDFDEDFRNRYGLRYAPYDEVDFGDTSPDDIRLNNQENVTVHSFQGLNPNGTLLVGPDNKLINQQRLTELSLQYRTDNNEALRRKYYHLKGEKPLEQKNPEFYLLAGGAHAMLGLANEGLAAAVVDPMVNMQLTDGFIDDTTPYTGWGDMMSNEVGGSELMWDMAHPAIVKDVVKGAANAVKNAVSPSKARTGVVGDFIDHSNMPEPSANWNGDWAALEEYRATHGGQERLQAAYDELSKAASTNANAKAKIDALRQKHDAEQLALILQHIAKNGASAMYTRTPGLSELAAKLEQELAALYEELGYNKAYSNAPEYAANHYLVPTTEEIHNIPVTSEGDAAYSVIEPSVDEATGEVTFINRSVNNPYDGARGNMAFTHEVNHLYVPYADGQLEWLDMSKLDPRVAEYLKSRGGVEIADRGSLVKNYFGLREGEEVTPEMLQYAAEHYVDDVTARGGIDNDMSAFFSAITDYKAAADWINKWALGIVPIGAAATAATATSPSLTTSGEYAFGGPLIRIANNLLYNGGFSDLPEQRAYRNAVNLKAPYTNYEDAIDVLDSIPLRIKKFFDKGVSNCTLTVSQLYGDDPIARANTIVTSPLDHNFYLVDPEHVVPGTMVIASYPFISDYNPNLKYHTMIVTGFAPNDYEYTFRDGTKYQIKKGEPLVSYSRGKASADNYVHDIPLSVYNANSEGKTYNRYYRPIDENYPQVMLPEITSTK